MAKVRNILPASAWGFADQAVISAANFITMVLLGRQLGPTALGAYVVAYTVLLFANTVQNALFIQPHNVIGAKKTASEFGEYTSATLGLQMGFSFLVFGVLALIGVVLAANGQPSRDLFFALSLASFPWQTQEFVRRSLYTRGKTFDAFLNDLLTHSMQVIAILITWRAGILTDVTAMLLLGASTLVGAGVGIWQIRESLSRVLNRQTVIQAASENWLYARWLLGGTTMSWLSSQLFPLLTAGLIGTTAAGGMRAAQTFLGPTHILLKGLEAMGPPRAVAAFERGGKEAFQSSLQRLSLPISAVMCVYCVVIAVFAEPIMRLLMGEEYVRFAWFVRVYALLYVIRLVTIVLSVALRSLGATAALFSSQATSAVFVVSLGTLLVHQYGLRGTAIGLISSALISLLIMWSKFSQVWSHAEPTDLSVNRGNQ